MQNSCEEMKSDQTWELEKSGISKEPLVYRDLLGDTVLS